MSDNDTVELSGHEYLSASEAAARSGLTRDHIARLCRSSRLAGKRIGTHWYVRTHSLESFMILREHERSVRASELSRRRKDDYIGSNALPAESDNVPVFPRRESTDRPKLEQRPMRAKDHTRDLLSRAVSQDAHRALNVASELNYAPGGFTSAMLQTTSHLSPHTLTPVLEAVHRLAAMFFAILVVFGVYMGFDPVAAHTSLALIQETPTDVARAIDDMSAISRSLIAGGVPGAASQVGAAFSAMHIGSARVNGQASGRSNLETDQAPDPSVSIHIEAY